MPALSSSLFARCSSITSLAKREKRVSQNPKKYSEARRKKKKEKKTRIIAPAPRFAPQRPFVFHALLRESHRHLNRRCFLVVIRLLQKTNKIDDCIYQPRFRANFLLRWTSSFDTLNCTYSRSRSSWLSFCISSKSSSFRSSSNSPRLRPV